MDWVPPGASIGPGMRAAQPSALQGVFAPSVSQQPRRSSLRKTILAKTILAAAAVAAVSAPMAAEARPKHRELVCSNSVRRSANTGTVLGAVGGGLLGNAIGHNATGTIVGAGAGAVAGHQIAKNRAQRNCHYVYR
jgi:uncharacterized protein YcfJ